MLLHKPTSISEEKSEPAIDTTTLVADIVLIPARNKCGPYFILTIGDANEITACDIPTLANSFEPELYFPCHEHCVKITEWVAEAQGLRREEAWRKVYEVLEIQLEKNIEMNNKIQPVTNLVNVGKYGTLWQVQELEWRSYLEGTEKYEADPLDIPHLGEYLLTQLAALSSRPSTLPQSAKNPNEEESPPSRPSTCEFPVPPEQIHPILPHIWDFEQVPEAARGSNWVTLMEWMRSIAIIEPEGVFQHVPEGIRNQRRIWALVDDLLNAEGNKGK
ncbi:MAG: hypothetical protein Q9225_007329 [Loekoesia sp. 1 TL-2023]